MTTVPAIPPLLETNHKHCHVVAGNVGCVILCFGTVGRTLELAYASVAFGRRRHSLARLLPVTVIYYLAIFDALVAALARFGEIGEKYSESLAVSQ